MNNFIYKLTFCLYSLYTVVLLLEPSDQQKTCDLRLQRRQNNHHIFLLCPSLSKLDLLLFFFRSTPTSSRSTCPRWRRRWRWSGFAATWPWPAHRTKPSWETSSNICLRRWLKCFLGILTVGGLTRKASLLGGITGPKALSCSLRKKLPTKLFIPSKHSYLSGNKAPLAHIRDA